MTQNNDEAFDLADKAIKEAYPDFNNKGNGWWRDERIPNYGILRGAIAKAIRKAQSPISQNEQQEGWISVDIRLPSAMQEVLLTNSDGYFVHGKPLFHNSTGEFNCWIYTLYSQDVLDFITQYRPTHWMPLPSPPTSETNTEVGE